MSDSQVLSRYATRLADERADLVQEAEACEELGAFGWLRGTRDHAVMLELRKRDGNILAVGYAWLEKAEFDPSEGITLHFGGQMIRIKGQNLNSEIRPMTKLFEGITRHRVPWVQEAKSPALADSDVRAVIVDSITW